MQLKQQIITGDDLSSANRLYIGNKPNPFKESATVNVLPNSPTAGNNSSSNYCTSIIITATTDNVTGAETPYWYSDPTGGNSLYSGTSFTTPTLCSTTTYYAESRNNSTGCSSSSRTAVVAYPYKWGAPSLVSPNNDERYLNDFPQYNWNYTWGYGDVDYYVLEISIDPSFNNLYDYKPVFPSDILPVYANNTLNSCGNYYWRVRAVKGGESRRSAEWNFWVYPCRQGSSDNFNNNFTIKNNPNPFSKQQQLIIQLIQTAILR